MEITLDYKPHFATPEDFKTYSGIDLSEELLPPQTPDSFMLDVEQRIINYISLQSWLPLRKMIRDNKLSQYQVNSLALAILQQTKYEFFNGTSSMDSGIDPERGKVSSRDDLNRAAICQDAIDTLQCSGLISRVMRGYY
jgi:hypothetical protein